MSLVEPFLRPLQLIDHRTPAPEDRFLQTHHLLRARKPSMLFQKVIAERSPLAFLTPLRLSRKRSPDPQELVDISLRGVPMSKVMDRCGVIPKVTALTRPGLSRIDERLDRIRRSKSVKRRLEAALGLRQRDIFALKIRARVRSEIRVIKDRLLWKLRKPGLDVDTLPLAHRAIQCLAHEVPRFLPARLLQGVAQHLPECSHRCGN